MPSGVELASAWVRLVPSMDGAQAEIAKSLGGVQSSVAAQGKATGSKFGSALAGAIGGAVALTASSALSALTGMVGDMAAQVDSTQKFAQTLSFAGIDTSHIDALTKSTQTYADKTVYSLSDIRNVTAQLASNGVKNYDKLAEAGGNLNAVAGGNAETFKSVGMVLTQTAGQGKLTTENWNQLSDAIPGASGKLQVAMLKNGAYTGNFRDAMSKGMITSEEFNQAIMELGSQPVAVEAAASTKTFEGAIGNMQAGVVKAGAAILTQLQPAITTIASDIGNFAAFLAPFLSNFQIMGPILAGVGAIILAALVPSIIAAVAATWAWTVALLANPMTWIVLGIGLLVAALVLLIMNWQAVVTWLQGVWAAVLAWLQAVLAAFVGFWVGLWNNILSFFQTVWNGIKTVALTVLGWIVAYIQGQINMVLAVWSAVWGAISAAAQAVWGAIKAAVSAGISFIVSFITSYMNGVKATWSAIWSGIQSIASSIWGGIKGAVSGGISAISSAITGGLNTIKGIWNSIWGGLASGVSSAFSAVIGAVKSSINGVISLVNGAIGKINSVGGAVGVHIGTIPGLANGGTVTHGGYTLVGENGPEVLKLPAGSQVNPNYDELPVDGGKGVTFNNYAPLGQSPAQALTEFSNRAKGIK